MITKEKLSLFCGSKKADEYYFFLQKEMELAQINTKNRVCSFLAQVLHESGNFSATVENMRYSAKRLTEVWPRMFPTLESAQPFNTPQKIANKVYGGRMGNDLVNDGWMYIGRGIIGNTGKSQYEKLTKALGIDLIHQPHLLESPEVAVKAAVWFWKVNNLNALADVNDFKGVTKKINGGYIGLKDREEKYKKLIEIYDK